MTVDLTVSHDTCQPSAICQDNQDIRCLQPRRAKQFKTSPWGRKALLRLTTSIGLGAFVTVATATAATAPAAANALAAMEDVQSRIVLPDAAEISLAGIPMPDTVVSPPIKPDFSIIQREPDPLKAIVPVEPADVGDVRSSIIAAMPLTSPPAFQGDDNGGKAQTHSEDVMVFGEMRVPRWIVDAVLRASEQTGVDPVYMMALADKESSFIPGNEASTSSAQGLYQFITSTWLEVIRSFGADHGFSAEAEAVQVVDGQLVVANAAMEKHILDLRLNPYLSTLMAAELKKRDRTKIESKLGREIGRSEFYLSHFFGVDGARRFMSLLDAKPKQSASRIFPAAARANKTLFFAKAGRKMRQLTMAEVYDKIDAMIDKRVNRYEDVTALAVADASL
jgi:hypothetical protein